LDTSDIIADRLIDWGVKVIFGLPGDGINGMMEALRKRQDKIKFVLVRHEEGAAFEACGYSKFTGNIGVCLATSGPGGLHLINGLYDAHMDNRPVLAITGRTYTDLAGSGYQQDVDLIGPFERVAGFNQLIANPWQARMATDQAMKYAIENRDVAHISIPIDIQVEPLSKNRESEHDVPNITSNGVGSLIIPPQNALRQAADILKQGKRIVIFCGAGAMNAGDEIVQLAGKLNAVIVKALLGKAVVPDEEPHCLGGIGLLGTAPSEDAMEQADTLLMVGTSFPYFDYLPKPGQARGIQIDIKGDRIGTRYPVDIGLVGDARLTLIELNKLTEQNQEKAFLTNMQGKMKDWWDLMNNRGTRKDLPMKPQVVPWALTDLLDDDAIITTDSGTITTWAARYIKIRRSQLFSCSGSLASMANGLPYAIGAQVAFPERQVVALVGDGGLAMLMCEFSTAVEQKLPIKVIVFKNGTLGQIKWEQIGFLGNPTYGVDFADIDFVKFAEACHGVGLRIERPDEAGPVLKAALAQDKPTIVEAIVDPNEPPNPAKLTKMQIENFAKALVKGEPNRGRIALTLFRDKINEL
jgi:pyruvate dehydrogenase (quinone)